MYNTLNQTHNSTELLIHQGAIIYTPKSQSKHSLIVSHKNTATIGDFANTWPLLSQLSKEHGPIEVTLPNVYQKFNGLKEFLEYQQFIKSVDFEDRDSDIDVQAHANYSTNQPYRCYFTADQLNQSIDTDLNLQVEPVQIPDNIKDKIVIIDRTVNNILYNTGWFKTDEYHWLDFSKPLSYNINICLNAKKIISTFTGLPIILDLFNAKFDLIWFDDINGPQAYKEHYFSDRNSKLFYYKDYYEQVDIHNTI